jgi:site-specific recombinase XerD
LNIQFADIDVEWLRKYEKWLRAKNNKETTISLLFRTLRSAYNRAIEAKCAKPSTYPFDAFKVSKFDVKTRKRALRKEDVLKIMHLDLSGENGLLKLSRDIFIFSYLCAGINFTDVANLRPESIANGRLRYVRQKTGGKIDIPISMEAMDIASRYGDQRMESGYVFPVLHQRRHKTALQKQNRIHKILGRLNSDLRTIAAKCGILDHISSYWSRHSFSTVLKRSGVDIALISETLGHQSTAVTTIYLDSFEDEQIDLAMSKLI